MRVHPSDAKVREVGSSTVEATLTIAARGIGLELASFALRSLEHGEVTPDAVARIAGEIARSSPDGADEVAARYLGRLTRTAYGNQVGWSQEKK